MNLNRNDLPESLSYLTLLHSIFSVFRKSNSFEDFISRIGSDHLIDVSELPEFKIMDGADPLPPEFSMRVYQFYDAYTGNGVLDVAFRKYELANIRAQLFLLGWFARTKAKKYLWNALVPSFQAMFGEPIEKTADSCTFYSSGIYGVTRRVAGTPSLSAYFTDERYI